MKANQVSVQAVSSTTAAGLATAINTFLDGLGEATMIAIDFALAADGGTVTYAALITYTR